MIRPNLPPVRDDGIQIAEHRRSQERFWTVERVAWICFGLIVIAALLGAFGSGGLLATKITETRAAVIEHPRIGRWEGTDEMTIRFKPDPSRQAFSLRLSPSFAESFQVEDVQPLPARSTIGSDGQTLFFDVPNHSGGAIKLHLRAQSAGSASFEISVNDGQPETLTSFIFP
jgi:hypothetical protein